MGREEKGHIHTKDKDNQFNKIIPENFPTLRMRRSSRCRKLMEHENFRTKK
jgi:hypothetical protein